jgi:Zn-dependent alcohol dehydrogenase
MRWEEVTVGHPGPNEVRIRHVAVGLNYADTYFRTGLYPVPLPNGMGVEASGSSKRLVKALRMLRSVIESLTQAARLVRTVQSA